MGPMDIWLWTLWTLTHVGTSETACAGDHMYTIHDHSPHQTAELTRETSHMPVVPHGYTPEALQHPPIGAHPRGRLLDGARATFTDPSPRPRTSTTDTHRASLLLQLRLQFYLATFAHYRMDLDTRSYA